MTDKENQYSLDFDPQVGESVRWKGKLAKVLEIRGCSTYLISIDDEEQLVDYVELAAGQE